MSDFITKMLAKSAQELAETIENAPEEPCAYLSIRRISGAYRIVKAWQASADLDPAEND